MAKQTKETPKARHFAFLLYPDSSPADWIEKLEAIGQPMAISPIHDKDRTERKTADAIRKEIDRKVQAMITIDNADQYDQIKAQITAEVDQRENNLPMYKKPHYHVLYVASNPVTADSVRRKIQRALGQQAVALVQIVDNVEGAYQYLTHESKDAVAKHKHVYDKSDIKLLNNYDIDRYVVMDAEQKKDMLLLLMDIICESRIINIIRLRDWLKENGETYGLDDRSVTTVIKENAALIRMCFDASYQEVEREGAQE